LNEKIIVYMRTGSMATAYTFIIDPVLIYTFNFSCKVLNEKGIVYTRTGSLGTAYTVIIDPVLIYTFNFSSRVRC